MLELRGVSHMMMRMRGEDLLSDPDAYLPVITEWLGISSIQDAFEQMKHPEYSPFACYGPNNARIGNDPSFLENTELIPYRVKPQSLEDAMSWDPSLYFNDEIKELAVFFGY